VSAAANVQMGPLSRMCQASYLQGLVHQFNKSRSIILTGDQQQEYQQLNRTIVSLLNLTIVEGEIRRMAVCGQTSICYRYSLSGGMSWV
jgi:hypothetical protein